MKVFKQIPTFVNRSYKGGKLLGKYLGNNDAVDSYMPEDWISSFVEAKNPVKIENEGLTKVCVGGQQKLLCDLVDESAFGQGRTECGVLIKLLDAAERLSIQVHPTKEFAKKHFGVAYGKTECWHILDTRDDNASIYIGFKENVTKEQFKKTFDEQDIPAMLDTLHRFEVKKGDTVLVTAGTPHAIGEGCFLLEIQEPTDYTMRSEKTTVSGLELTPFQIHYGIGEEAMLDCFLYENASTRQKAREKYFIDSKPDTQIPSLSHIVTYDNTNCFKLDKVSGDYSLLSPCFVTAVATESIGKLICDDCEYDLKRGDKFFIPANTDAIFKNANVILCYPPQINK